MITVLNVSVDIWLIEWKFFLTNILKRLDSLIGTLDSAMWHYQIQIEIYFIAII